MLSFRSRDRWQERPNRPVDLDTPTPWQLLLHFLLPALCLACDEPVFRRGIGLGLCRRCRGGLQQPRDACPRCGLPAGSRSGDRLARPGECRQCRSHPPAFDRLLAGWLYQPPLDAVVHALKFRRLERLGDDLGRALVLRFGTAIGRQDLVVPVPLHWARRLRRGYNQSAAIARRVGRQIGVPHRQVLRRVRATGPQMTLPRELRQRNLRDAFRPLPWTDLRGQSVLLVDDVATTGATLDAAARALRRAGAARVTALVAARTP